MDPVKITTMEELASVSGVSRPTVSKYFNDPTSVRPSIRNRIEGALERYDYRPNIFAINQNRKATRTVGILVPYLSDPFFTEIVRVIERQCIEAGLWPILFSAHGQTELENKALATLQSLRPAGALIAPLGRESDIEIVRRFTEEIPTVVFDSNLEVGHVFVGHDNFQSTGTMVDYLCRTGEPPCFLEMPPVNPNANKRRNAFKRAMEERGHEPQIVHIDKGGWNFEEIGYGEGLKLIAERKFPSDTILCSNDRIAHGLLAAAYAKGLRVGRGEGCAIRIAGQDNHPLSRFTCPPLTTVSQDYQLIAERSASALMAMIENGPPSGGRQSTMLEGQLIVRSSA